MARGNFSTCLSFTLKFEGGFVNNPKDPGGPTNLGVTQATLSRFQGRPVTIADVEDLTPATVAPIYQQGFWDKVSGDDLPAGVDLAVFDFAVHSGPTRAVVGLQRAVGVADDGVIGPITVAAARTLDPSLIVQRVCAGRLTFLTHLTIFQTFGPGLKSRVAKCEAAALSMIAVPLPQAMSA
jgi:lysozyme family protein